MSLRRRLVVVQVLLVALGLGAFGIISYQLYSRSEYARVDGQLQSATPLLGRLIGDRYSRQTPGSTGNGGAFGGGRPDNLPPGSFVELRPVTGPVVTDAIPCYGQKSCPKPELAAALTPGHSPGGRLITVPSTDDSTEFRALVRPSEYPGGPGAAPPVGVGPQTAIANPEAGAVVITAIPLGDVTRSLHRLIIVDLAVGVVVLLALSGSVLLMVRRGLRPLERMSATARAIAGGDLSRRATPADDRSEVGQLGAAFNAMMGNIEQAFTQRDATEARLRQFLADASHELRTPLTSIRGYAELYRMGAASSGDELNRVMNRIETHAIEMGGLVEELLVLARLDQTRPPERIEVDLSVLAAECCHDAAVTAPDRRLTLDAPDPVGVVGDPVHLRWAITNLLTNARRHTPAGSPVEVTVAEEVGRALVSVRDHGPGLPPEGLDHAFDRFWRADPSRRGEGAGLGLAIVAAVAAEHGGRAEVANAPDGGAVFTVRLPVPAMLATPEAQAAAGQRPPAPATVIHSGQSQRHPITTTGDSEQPSSH